MIVLKYVLIHLHLGSRLYVGVILLSCLMAKLGDGKGKFEQNVQTSPSDHAQNPMGRSKGNMGSTSQQLSTPTRLATEQTPEIPAHAEATMHDSGNASILRCSDSAVETDTPTQRKRPARHDKDDKEKPVSEIQRLLALANDTLPVAKAAKTEKDEYESGQQSKRPRKTVSFAPTVKFSAMKKKPSDG